MLEKINQGDEDDFDKLVKDYLEEMQNRLMIICLQEGMAAS